MTKLTTPIDFLKKRYLRAWVLADMIGIADLMKVELEKLSSQGDEREICRAERIISWVEQELTEFKAR